MARTISEVNISSFKQMSNPVSTTDQGFFLQKHKNRVFVGIINTADGNFRWKLTKFKWVSLVLLQPQLKNSA